MSPNYTFAAQHNWSKREVYDRVLSVAEQQLGAISIEEATAAEDKGGTDWWAHVPSRPKISIDHKLRKSDWPDVDLEIVSVSTSGRPGWAVDRTKRTDFILYLWPSRSLLLSYPQLRSATIANRKDWERIYSQRGKTTTEGRYETKNLHVPEAILLDAMYPELRSISLLPAKDVWLALPRRCFTCGREPDGRYQDGSPQYSCSHSPVPLIPPRP